MMSEIRDRVISMIFHLRNNFFPLSPTFAPHCEGGGERLGPWPFNCLNYIHLSLSLLFPVRCAGDHGSSPLNTKKVKIMSELQLNQNPGVLFTIETKPNRFISFLLPRLECGANLDAGICECSEITWNSATDGGIDVVCRSCGELRYHFPPWSII